MYNLIRYRYIKKCNHFKIYYFETKDLNQQ